MKKLSTILLTLATVMVLGACSRDKDSNGEFDFSGERTVDFTASIATVGSQPATKWSLGDAIGIYALDVNQPLAQDNLYREKGNVKYTTASTATFGEFKSAKPTDAIQKACLPMDIISYYPYQNEINDFQYAINTVNQQILLYADNLKNLRNPKDAHLEFNHKLSLLILNIEPEDKNTSLAELKSDKLEGTLTEGKMDLVTGIVTTNEEIVTNTIKPTVSAEDKSAQVRAILLPGQSIQNVKLQLVLDGKEVIWTPETELTLESGKIYIYTIQLKSDGQIITVNPDAEIKDWVEGADGSLDVLNPDDTDPGTPEDGTVTVDTYVQFGELGGDADVAVKASAEEVEWTVNSEADWLTVAPESGKGSGKFVITATENNSGADRTGVVNISTKSTPQVITVYQTSRAIDGEDVIVMNERFGENDGAKWDLLFGEFDSFQGFDTKGVVFSNKGSRLSARARGNFMEYERHVWMPAYNPKYPITEADPAPTLNVSQIDTQGLKDITVSFDMTGNFNNNPLFVDYISLTADGEAIALEKKELTKAEFENSYYTVTVKISKPFSVLEFKTDERNLTGIRFDNLKIVGKK